MAALLARQPSRLLPLGQFPYGLPFQQLDLRANPHLYRPGRGEQGVLMVEPYKSEILPHWAFKDPGTATQSAQTLRTLFETYVQQGDFVGADMTRKFIQMGFTRSRRYANHAGGKKYVTSVGKDKEKGHGKREQIPRLAVEDPVKAESARIFAAVLDEVKANQRYAQLRHAFEIRYKDVRVPLYGEAREAKGKSSKANNR